MNSPGPDTAAGPIANTSAKEPHNAQYEPRRREPALTVAPNPNPPGDHAGSGLCVIAVAVNPYVDLPGGRTAFNPNRETDAALLARFESAWFLQQQASRWNAVPVESPSVLLAVDVSAVGPDRYVLGAVTIDRSGWGLALLGGPGLTIPTVTTPGLDAHQLRGRRINLTFGQLPHEQFRVCYLRP